MRIKRDNTCQAFSVVTNIVNAQFLAAAAVTTVIAFTIITCIPNWIINA